MGTLMITFQCRGALQEYSFTINGHTCTIEQHVLLGGDKDVMKGRADATAFKIPSMSVYKPIKKEKPMDLVDFEKLAKDIWKPYF